MGLAQYLDQTAATFPVLFSSEIINSFLCRGWAPFAEVLRGFTDVRPPSDECPLEKQSPECNFEKFGLTA